MVVSVPLNEPIKHHYVPQFYMRQFACVDDTKKVMTLERHRNVVVADRKSIEGIGYEERLHDYKVDGVPASIEGPINKIIETPFSQGSTWRKISGGQCAGLDQSDRVPLYGFARHLQLRNISMLEFIHNQHARYLTGELKGALTEEEQELHARLAVDPGAAHGLFREGAMDTRLPADASEINVIVCQTPIPLRSSTNPTVMVSYPRGDSIFGAMFNSLRTWWLTLDRHWGAFIVAGGPARLTVGAVPQAIAQVVNRQYLTQFLNGSARYILGDDGLLGEDLEWAGFEFEKRTTHGFRYRSSTGTPAASG